MLKNSWPWKVELQGRGKVKCAKILVLCISKTADFVQMFFVDTYGYMLWNGEIKSWANFHIFVWGISKFSKTPIRL